jgi:NAD(P)-dependent dehydrogenase (short-subunit alcohol dehydrogenase family)
MNDKTERTRSVAIITGAHGGMGIACAHVFGRRHRLILTDRNTQRLETLRGQLIADGVDVAATIAGDLSSKKVLLEVVDAAKTAGRLQALIHTAGLSPALSDWEDILEVNLMVTLRLVDAVEPLLEPGAAAVLVASIAAHLTPVSPAVSAAIDAALSGAGRALLDDVIKAAGGNMAGAAYGFSKYGVIRLARQRARAWAKVGARIVTISPGLIATPMGLKEAAESPAAEHLVKTTPVGRWGTPLDIANAAEFLCSDLAGFISGCDLQVDGGVVGAMAFANA